MRIRLGLTAVAAALVAACGGGASSPDPGAGYTWDLPAGFPTPVVPADNPMSAVKVELGRRLFYDVRLSGNQTFSCASCHLQELAFTDGRARGLGSTGMLHPRGPQQLANLAYFRAFTWANSVVPEPGDAGARAHDRERPRGARHLRHGRDGGGAARGRPGVPAALPRLLPRGGPALHLPEHREGHRRLRADAHLRELALRPVPARRRHGALRLGAAGHGPLLLGPARLRASATPASPSPTPRPRRATPGTPSRSTTSASTTWTAAASYPADGTGLEALTFRPEDMGKFRTPPLRNVAVTAPYMHDGSVATLSEVIDLFAAGGRARMQNGVAEPAPEPARPGHSPSPPGRRPTSWPSSRR